MALPRAVAQTLVDFGFQPDVRAGVAELYRFLGPASVEALVDLTEGEGRDPGELRPDDLQRVRAIVGARYLAANHRHWKEGSPTPAFWRDRSVEGGATGLAIPLGDLEDGDNPFAALVASAATGAAGPDQPPPRGLLILTRGGHYGNRPGEFSVDLVPSDLESALAVNESLGQQHTLAGSIGEASGSATTDRDIALLWEIQPNIYKPSKDRNQSAGKAFRKHRNWHLITSIAALAWLEQSGYDIHVIRGSALALAHEVNPDKPVLPEIEAFHERTIAAALGALGLTSIALEADDDPGLDGIVRRVFSHHVDGRALSDLVTCVVRRERADAFLDTSNERDS